MTKASSSGTSASKCPRCGASGTGAFCSNCGAALAGSSCRSCQAPLTSGARFCHRCGTPVDGSHVPVASANALAARRDPVPWAVAAIALVALIALIAGGRFFGSLPSDPAVAETPAVTRGPDLSRMTPRDITDRLFNRVMTLHEAGLDDSVKFLALNMAIPAFELHDSLDIDLRYHLGRIAEVSGVLDKAKAQADTILREKPTHLLGLALAARVARLQGNNARATAFDKRLLAAEKSEMALGLREYEEHKFDLDSALARARRGAS